MSRHARRGNRPYCKSDCGQSAKSEHMSDSSPPEDPPEHEKSRLHRFEDAVHDRLLAAEVAAEEAAGFGSLTAAREAAEAAANPAHELGGDDEPEAEPGAATPKA